MDFAYSKKLFYGRSVKPVKFLFLIMGALWMLSLEAEPPAVSTSPLPRQFDWGDARGCMTEFKSGVLTQKLSGNRKYGLICSIPQTCGKKREYEFAAKVKAPKRDMAFVQVKLYREGKELKCLSSKTNARLNEVLSVHFNSGDADKLELICRIARKGYKGKSVIWNNFYFGVPRSPRTAMLEPAPRVEVVPGFQVCGVYLNHCQAADYPEISGRLFFRQKGHAEWRQALPPVFVRHERSLRGSLLQLKEATAYELKLSVDDCGKKEEFIRGFHTKSSSVPIVKTIVLQPDNARSVLQPESGTAVGYVRYTAPPGFVLNPGKKADAAVLFDGVSYVILDGVKIRGGLNNGLTVRNSHHIRIVNCDIAGYGRTGKFRPDLDGKYYVNGQPIWLDSGIYIVGSDNIVVERNYIHDPDACGNSWFYSHPATPEGIAVCDSSSVALRYNDIIGSDLKRWNDGIAGDGNFLPDGGLKRDAEVCGNYIAFGNDDGAELEGGQMNTRFFHNRIEGFYCGVSLANCLRGPSYVFQNEFINPGDQYDLGGIGIKMISGISSLWGPVFLLENKIFWQPIGIYPPHPLPKKEPPVFLLYARGNKYLLPAPYSIFKDRTDFSTDIDDIQRTSAYLPKMPEEFPGRPVGFSVSNSEILLSQVDGESHSKQITINVTRPGLKSYFNIVQPAASRHFKVTPTSGILEYGKDITLTVSSSPENISIPRRNTGAFAVRLSNGYSRPVSVTVDSRRNPRLLEAVRAKAIYGKVRKNKDSSMDLIFNLPQAGNFYLFVKCSVSNPSSMALVSHNQEKPEVRRLPSQLYTGAAPWRCARETPRGGNRPLKLSAGRHVFHIEPYKNYRHPDYTECALTDAPNAFRLAPDDL